jgi:hypothetical protein
MQIDILKTAEGIAAELIYCSIVLTIALVITAGFTQIL